MKAFAFLEMQNGTDPTEENLTISGKMTYSLNQHAHFQGFIPKTNWQNKKEQIHA